MEEKRFKIASKQIHKNFTDWEQRVMKLPAYHSITQTTGETGGTLCTCWLLEDGSPKAMIFIHKLKLRARTKATKSFFI